MTKQIQFVQFGILSPDDILKFAVCEIVKTSTRGQDLTGTPYDERMGALDNGKECLTCGFDNMTCPGHFGYIRLEEPIYNPKYIRTVLQILKCVCVNCSQPRISKEHAELQGLLKKVRGNRLKAFVGKCEKLSVCSVLGCGSPLPKFEYKDVIKMYYDENSSKIELTARQCLSIFLKINHDTMKLLGFNHELASNSIFSDDSIITDEDKIHVHELVPSSFFFTIFPVIPPCARPWVMRDGEKHDDDITTKINEIIKLNNSLKPDVQKTKRKAVALTELNRASIIQDLINHIYCLIDNHKDKKSTGGRASKGLSDRLGGKQGRIQANITGKRVDYSARTVIDSGGTLLGPGEVGIPLEVSKIITYPELVNSLNIQELQNLVNKGKANFVIRNGNRIRLNIVTQNFTRYYEIRIGDTVERHLRDGDVCLLNRQPTLRVESMMGVKMKFLNENVFRLPVYLCTAFNADFDGDK